VPNRFSSTANAYRDDFAALRNLPALAWTAWRSTRSAHLTIKTAKMHGFEAKHTTNSAGKTLRVQIPVLTATN
jgi:hypothetical protein